MLTPSQPELELREGGMSVKTASLSVINGVCSDVEGAAETVVAVVVADTDVATSVANVSEVEAAAAVLYVTASGVELVAATPIMM